MLGDKRVVLTSLLFEAPEYGVSQRLRELFQQVVEHSIPEGAADPRNIALRVVTEFLTQVREKLLKEFSEGEIGRMCTEMQSSSNKISDEILNSGLRVFLQMHQNRIVAAVVEKILLNSREGRPCPKKDYWIRRRAYSL